ncbi:hypothetical protein MSAS_47480 [Mycobacterium saskatchewanense]|uniref:Uncharacterized protein n=1 Tax=Mycobacterium saskatchewanense TaxID=220927 RepID=A0AAJ3NQA5_9MYCO|nr:hypothetical protein [Mycobacterium saskatchewanense]ORW71483.1 hypothetical protein AWC23_13790 [Mycobacterium saskatchewanense]BBX65574.1 hypothetical protein MSAS_47480 [Mycobacterium saskatchewanense]
MNHESESETFPEAVFQTLDDLRPDKAPAEGAKFYYGFIYVKFWNEQNDEFVYYLAYDPIDGMRLRHFSKNYEKAYPELWRPKPVEPNWEWSADSTSVRIHSLDAAVDTTLTLSTDKFRLTDLRDELHLVFKPMRYSFKFTMPGKETFYSLTTLCEVEGTLEGQAVTGLGGLDRYWGSADSYYGSKADVLEQDWFMWLSEYVGHTEYGYASIGKDRFNVAFVADDAKGWVKLTTSNRIEPPYVGTPAYDGRHSAAKSVGRNDAEPYVDADFPEGAKLLYLGEDIYNFRTVGYIETESDTKKEVPGVVLNPRNTEQLIRSFAVDEIKIADGKSR